MSRSLFSTSPQRVESQSPTKLGWQFSGPPRWSSVHLVRTLGPSRDPLRARTRSASLRTRNPNTDPRQAESTLRFLGLGFCRIRFETRYPATQDYIQYRPGLKYPGHPALTTVRVRADTACTNRSRFMPIGYDRLYHPSQTLRTVLSITAL